MIEVFKRTAKVPVCPEPLVLLHGWGSDSRSWEPLRDTLNQHYHVWEVSLPGFASSAPTADLELWLEQLTGLLPERCILVGWSLGGMLATQLAARLPHRVMGLVTLASNLCFVAREGWPAGMSLVTFAEFLHGFENNPDVALKRFAGLMATGDLNAKPMLKTLRVLSAESLKGADPAEWLKGLRWLESMDNRAAFAQLRQPGLHLLAENDALVPAQAATLLQAVNPRQQVATLAEACHALHWSHTDTVAAKLLAFVEQVHYTLDKTKVAKSFGRAAYSYDSVAGLQREIGHNLLRQMDCQAEDTECWLDLGCGTGYFEPLLSDQLGLPHQQLIGLDLSEGMLQFCRSERGGSFQWLCGDAEALPLASASVNGIFSTLAIQWCSNLPQLFSELRRILKPGGRIHLATLGPRTLSELRAAWTAVDQFTHVNRFASEATVQSAIAQSGLDLVGWHNEDIILQYQELKQLTHELKALGAHNMNHGQSAGLTGRQRIQAFKQAYETYRQVDGNLPATYEVFYLELACPQ